MFNLFGAPPQQGGQNAQDPFAALFQPQPGQPNPFQPQPGQPGHDELGQMFGNMLGAFFNPAQAQAMAAQAQAAANPGVSGFFLNV